MNAKKLNHLANSSSTLNTNITMSRYCICYILVTVKKLKSRQNFLSICKAIYMFYQINIITFIYIHYNE